MMNEHDKGSYTCWFAMPAGVKAAAAVRLPVLASRKLMPDAAVMSLSGLKRPGILRALSLMTCTSEMCNNFQQLSSCKGMRSMEVLMRIKPCLHDAVRELLRRQHVEHVRPTTAEAASAGCWHTLAQCQTLPGAQQGCEGLLLWQP